MVRIQKKRNRESKFSFSFTFAAEFVDIIHTDRIYTGTSYQMGHVDFWPSNATVPLPGCPPLTHVNLTEQLLGKYPSQSKKT